MNSANEANLQLWIEGQGCLCDLKFGLSNGVVPRGVKLKIIQFETDLKNSRLEFHDYLRRNNGPVVLENGGLLLVLGNKRARNS